MAVAIGGLWGGAVYVGFYVGLGDVSRRDLIIEGLKWHELAYDGS